MGNPTGPFDFVVEKKIASSTHADYSRPSASLSGLSLESLLRKCSLPASLVRLALKCLSQMEQRDVGQPMPKWGNNVLAMRRQPRAFSVAFSLEHRNPRNPRNPRASAPFNLNDASSPNPAGDQSARDESARIEFARDYGMSPITKLTTHQEVKFEAENPSMNPPGPMG